VCKHCGKDITEAEKPWYNRNTIGCASVVGAFFVIAGLWYWPFWILAVLLFILAAVSKK
jgi:uncharacterized protein (DUF983 family)